MPKPVQVAIIGASGSGKTWLAQKIFAALQPNAVHIRLDDFYRGLPPLDREQQANVNFDDPAAIDWDCVRSVMEALSRGQTAAVPSYDFATHTRNSARLAVSARDFIIWDGLWLLREPWLRQHFGVSVFVDCTGEERLARRLARDVLERGRTPQSVRRQFEEQVEPMRERYVEPQRRWAGYHLASPMEEAALRELLDQIRAAGESSR